MATDTETEPATTAPPRVLVVDDERSMRELLTIVLKRDGYEVLVAEDGKRAIELLKKQRVDILITDIRMPQMSGVDVLREAKNIDPEIISIVMTAFATTDTAVEALRLGAADYVHKSPSAANELRLRVRKELERKQLQRENVLLKRALGSAHKFSNIIGRSDPMVSVFQLIETIAPTSSTVLITGESGTGKELAARAIHFNSLRKERPFVALNCGALSETLLDSELFGHMKGAFTGADTNKKGLIEVAEKGSIFLDEIGEMSSLVQVKLLRVLQERKYRRLGGTEEVEADIRVIAATNRDLSKMVAEGTFREDLFYRINVIPIRLPALRERVEDIPLLAEHFVPRFASEMGKTITGISGAALACLQAYGWPGNIRELENAIERAVALERTPTILVESLPEQVRGAAPTVAGTAAPADNFPVNGFDLEQHVQHIEREVHRRSAQARRRRESKGSRASRHVVSLVPVLHEEVRPQVGGSRGSRFGARDSSGRAWASAGERSVELQRTNRRPSKPQKVDGLNLSVEECAGHADVSGSDWPDERDRERPDGIWNSALRQEGGKRREQEPLVVDPAERRPEERAGHEDGPRRVGVAVAGEPDSRGDADSGAKRRDLRSRPLPPQSCDVGLKRRVVEVVQPGRPASGIEPLLHRGRAEYGGADGKARRPGDAAPEAGFPLALEQEIGNDDEDEWFDAAGEPEPCADGVPASLPQRAPGERDGNREEERHLSEPEGAGQCGAVEDECGGDTGDERRPAGA